MFQDIELFCVMKHCLYLTSTPKVNQVALIKKEYSCFYISFAAIFEYAISYHITVDECLKSQWKPSSLYTSIQCLAVRAQIV